MVKAIHLVESLDDSYGGPARSVPCLLSGLIKRGVAGCVLSVDVAGARNATVEAHGLAWKVAEQIGPRSLRYGPKLPSLLAEELCADSILHLHSLWTYPTRVALNASREFNVPIVLSARSSLYANSLKKSRLKKAAAKILFVDDVLHSVACIHATSEEEAAEVAKLGLVAPVIVIPNGVEMESDVSSSEVLDARRNFGLDINRRYLIYFSRIHPRKGLKFLAESWARLSTEFQDVDLIVAGPVDDEKYFSQVVGLVGAKGLEARFHFVGMMSGEMRRRVLVAGDLFVLPTAFENFGMAIGEALALGIPVITTKGTPWREIEEFRCGWWIELSEDSLDRCLTDALRQSHNFGEMGSRGRQLVNERYTWEAQAQRMVDVYDWILSENRVRPAPYEHR